MVNRRTICERGLFSCSLFEVLNKITHPSEPEKLDTPLVTIIKVIIIVIIEIKIIMIHIVIIITTIILHIRIIKVILMFIRYFLAQVTIYGRNI